MSPARPTLSEQILAAAQDGIICLDLEGRIKFANPAAARLLGCGVADELLDQPVRTYIQFVGLSSVQDEPSEATGLLLAGMTLLPRGEQVCWSEEGASFPIEYESAPIHEEGSMTGAVVTFRDNTVSAGTIRCSSGSKPGRKNLDVLETRDRCALRRFANMAGSPLVEFVCPTDRANCTMGASGRLVGVATGVCFGRGADRNRPQAKSDGGLA